eukprot:RCo005852
MVPRKHPSPYEALYRPFRLCLAPIPHPPPSSYFGYPSPVMSHSLFISLSVSLCDFSASGSHSLPDFLPPFLLLLLRVSSPRHTPVVWLLCFLSLCVYAWLGVGSTELGVGSLSLFLSF